MASGAAKRYAQAVIGLAKERGTLEAWHADLALLNSLTGESGPLSYFANPGVDLAQKRSMLDRLLATSQPEARNLAMMLLERGRLEIVPQLFELFEEGMRAEQGIVVAEVTTADPLGPEEQAMVRDRLAAMLGKRVELRTKVDPEIIGGIIARVGDLLIDGSVISRLRRLRARLAASS